MVIRRVLYNPRRAPFYNGIETLAIFRFARLIGKKTL